MKTLIIITTLLAVCSFKASDTKEIISRIPKTSIPFECTRTTPGARPITAIYPTGRELPQYIYDDITLSHKTSFKNYNSIFKRFEWPKTTFEVLTIRIGVSDPELGVLATLTQDGELIDYIEAEMLFYRDKPLYIMQYRIDKDATIIVTRLNLISDKPVMIYEEFSTIHAQRIDTYYKVGDDGKFQQIKQVKFEPASYTQDDLENENKNFWEGKETPLPEQ